MPYLLHQLLYLFYIFFVNIAGFHNPLPDHIYVPADSGELSVIFPKLIIVAIVGIVVEDHVPDILGFVPHAGCLNFVIKYILLIVTEEYFQLIGAVTLAAHKYHFLSKLPFPACMLFRQNRSISEERIDVGFALMGARGCNPLQAHLRHFAGRENDQQM